MFQVRYYLDVLRGFTKKLHIMNRVIQPSKVFSFKSLSLYILCDVCCVLN